MTNAPQRIIDFYTRIFSETDRLDRNIGSLERTRTIDILDRHLPEPPAVIIDVGGATGTYACWLMERGYEVHLIDLVLHHVEKARDAMERVAGDRWWSASVGDGSNLPFQTDNADVVLLMGPLYHLQEKNERLGVLGEASRVLRPGGAVVCAAISRFASFIDGLYSGYIHDPAFRNIIAGDLRDSCHRNPTEKPEYFTEAYFQHPSELNDEIASAGFLDVRVLAVEGVLWFTKNTDALREDESAWSAAMDFMRMIEGDASIIGASSHLLAIGKKSR